MTARRSVVRPRANGVLRSCRLSQGLETDTSVVCYPASHAVTSGKPSPGILVESPHATDNDRRRPTWFEGWFLPLALLSCSCPRARPTSLIILNTISSRHPAPRLEQPQKKWRLWRATYPRMMFIHCSGIPGQSRGILPKHIACSTLSQVQRKH